MWKRRQKTSRPPAAIANQACGTNLVRGTILYKYIINLSPQREGPADSDRGYKARQGSYLLALTMEDEKYRGQNPPTVTANVLSSSHLRMVNTRRRRGNGLQFMTIQLMTVLQLFSFIVIVVLSSYLSQNDSRRSHNASGGGSFDFVAPLVAEKDPSIVRSSSDLVATVPTARTQSNNPASVVLPNVFLAGAQKAGTSAVVDWLVSAHDVCKAQTFDDEPSWFAKEVHFFNNDERFKHGAEFYTKRFQHCNSSDFAMDATPAYALHAMRVGNFYRQLLPSLCSKNCSMGISLDGRVQGLKVMMILREPVARELSWYNHQKSEGIFYALKKANSNYSFDEYVDKVILGRPTRFSKENGQCSGALCRSLYSKLIPQWLDVIPRNHMLILSHQELKHDPGTFMKRIEDFLGLPPHKQNETLRIVNDKPYSEKISLPSCQSKNKLAGIFQPYNEDLYALLAQNPGPPMEQRPFPEFDAAKCNEDEGIV